MEKNVRDVRTNYDDVFKDAMTVFKDKTLDLLGLGDLAPIGEPLRTERKEVSVMSEFMDMAFELQDGRGLHIEEEVGLSNDDLLRFLGYNAWLGRTYRREFVTVILVKGLVAARAVKTGQVSFEPIIVECSKLDADAMLDSLKEGIAAGEPVNELKLIYLPLFGSRVHGPDELFKESFRLIKELPIDEGLKHKVFSLAIVLAGKVVSHDVLKGAIREVKGMGNIAIEIMLSEGREEGIKLGKELGIKLGEERGIRLGKERGEMEKAEKSAMIMLAKGFDIIDIEDVTGVSEERLRELIRRKVS